MTMREPEVVKGWRALRERMLTYLGEDTPGSRALAFLAACPAIAGELNEQSKELHLTFGCPRAFYNEFNADADLADELSECVEAATSPQCVSLSVAAQYMTPDELKAFRE